MCSGRPACESNGAPALEIYAGAGCRVDFEHQLVQIQSDVLAQAFKTAPAASACMVRAQLTKSKLH